MIIAHSSADLPAYESCVLATGAFDGIHIGHQAIIKQAISYARSKSLPCVVLTYWPHPRKILNPEAKVELLTSQKEKSEILSSLGVDIELELNFTFELSQISALQFLQEIVFDQLKAKTLFMGYDHTFGNNREGNVDFLKKHSLSLDYELIEIEKQWIEHSKISSTLIRESLKIGNLNKANALLGRPYSLQGAVVKGKQLGRTIGFPTANIQLDNEDKLLPALGVYAVRVVLNNSTLNGIMNVGMRPTVGGDSVKIEVHLFDYNQEIYNFNIKVELIEYLRAEKKFNSLLELKQQIELDCTEARSILSIYSTYPISKS